MTARRVYAAVVLGFSLVAGLFATHASAANLMPDLNPLTTDSTQPLRSGDFDGDGRVDRLQLITEDSGRIAVHVRLDTMAGIKDIRVTSVDARPNAPLNLQVVGPGVFQSECGDFSTDCTGAITTPRDSLILGLDGGVHVLMHWRDGGFEQDFVHSDFAMMAHALAGLLALNP